MFGKGGFTLLEAIVSIFIVTMGVGGVFTLVNQTINSTQDVSSKLKAIYLAQEGIEIVRHKRDNNFLAGTTWDNNLSAGVHYLDYTAEEKNTSNLVIWQENMYRHFSESNCSGNPNCQDTSFNRSIEIDYPQDFIMTVKSIVTWQERGINHQVTVQENLYNWLQ